MSKKSSPWFKHHSTSGRGLKIREIQHIYGHWAKGVYWDIVEILREQPGYKYKYNRRSIFVLADLIGSSEPSKNAPNSESEKSQLADNLGGQNGDEKSQLADIFQGLRPSLRLHDFFRDSIKIGLFIEKDGYFTCPPLQETMAPWETKVSNRKSKKSNTYENSSERNGNETETEGERNGNETETDGKRNGNEKATLREEKSRINKHSVKSELLTVFEFNRQKYPGVKRGYETELAQLRRHADWREVIPLLGPAIENQIRFREDLKKKGQFAPEWKNLKTWLSNRCWEDEVPIPTPERPKPEVVSHREMYPDAWDPKNMGIPTEDNSEKDNSIKDNSGG